MLNRQAMVDVIVKGMKLHVEEQFTTIHNYIDTDAMILRKGAVSAKAGERLLIPINMRDGSLLCVGKGNEDWNCSAPHGAGRLMSRADARQSFTVSAFKKQMAEVYTTSVSKATLDECPMAYKGMENILNQIGPDGGCGKDPPPHLQLQGRGRGLTPSLPTNRFHRSTPLRQSLGGGVFCLRRRRSCCIGAVRRLLTAKILHSRTRSDFSGKIEYTGDAHRNGFAIPSCSSPCFLSLPNEGVVLR